MPCMSSFGVVIYIICIINDIYIYNTIAISVAVYIDNTTAVEGRVHGDDIIIVNRCNGLHYSLMLYLS